MSFRSIRSSALREAGGAHENSQRDQPRIGGFRYTGGVRIANARADFDGVQARLRKGRIDEDERIRGRACRLGAEAVPGSRLNEQGQ